MTIRKTLVLLIVFATAVVSAGAASYVETWDGGTTEGWKIEDIDGGTAYGDGTGDGLTWDTSPLLDGEYEVLRINGGAAQGGVIENIIYADETSSGGNVVNHSDFTGGYRVNFDFYASEVPVSLDVFFEDHSGIQWVIGVALPDTGWNYSYQQMLSYSDSWTRLDGGTESSTTFTSSLQDVDEVGILLGYTGSGSEIYALDNFSVVPEPETWLMLGVALLSLSYTFRKRLLESLVAVRVRS